MTTTTTELAAFRAALREAQRTRAQLLRRVERAWELAEDSGDFEDIDTAEELSREVSETLAMRLAHVLGAAERAGLL